ncbi:hypothetical protein ACIGXM_13575 [Kitasatospora sp. NPDC052896]|uniref:hypothetical protein n=1 Tax=Kitasatospora sp. NPDC052896 TaxID=3364061 RepID=UPI0037C83D93
MARLDSLVISGDPVERPAEAASLLTACQLRVAGLRGQGLVAVAVAPGGAGVGVLAGFGAD